MLREDLKKELDKLNDEQLKKIADFIADLEFQSRQVTSSVPFWQRVTPPERARNSVHGFYNFPKVVQVYKTKPLAATAFTNNDEIFA